MTYNVKPIESLEPGRNWYEVIEADNEYHLWIVEHDPMTDQPSWPMKGADNDKPR